MPFLSCLGPLTDEQTLTVQHRTSGASGGTLSTILTILESLPLSELRHIGNPYALSALPAPTDVPSESIFSRLFGVRSVPDLGTLTTCPSGTADVTIMHRSSSLMPEFYGRRYFARQFLRVRNAFRGIAFHFLFTTGIALLMLPPVRALVKRYIYAPGSGPTREDSTNDRVEYRAIATADQDTSAVGGSPKRVFGRLTYEGPMYYFTGVLMGEAAMTVLENEDKIRKVSRGGIVTPASLGQEFVDRLDKAGCHIETKVLDH